MKEVDYPFDADILLRKRKKIKNFLLTDLKEHTNVRIAILGGSSTKDIRDMLELFLLNSGIKPSFYEAEYNRFYEEAVFDNRELEEFDPHIVYVYTTNRNVMLYPDMDTTPDEVNQMLQEEYQKYVFIWERIRKRYHAEIIQNNFEMPAERTFGQMDAVRVQGRQFFLTGLNQLFYEYARANEYLHICDINYISADYGLQKWSDAKYWYLYKYAVNVKAIPLLAYQIFVIIKSFLGKNKKCIVTDLDNTLWGGMIAEDGMDGIRIGNETAEGETFLAIQKYLEKKQRMGVILAVVSKNDQAVVQEGFAHKDMLLHADNFAVIKANFERKDENILNIAEELHILPESMVFIDDNPAELELVKESIPGISVVSAKNPENVIAQIERAGYFEPGIFTEEDMDRAKQYREDGVRKRALVNFTDYNDYLKSLEMEAELSRFTREAYGRITQLTNKSNQFNLTTRRYTQSEIENVAKDKYKISFFGRLKDRFGDNGIVSIIIAHKDGNAYIIDLWLMSCRVLKRDVEYAMFDHLVEQVQKRGITRIIGEYYPTEKNSMVKEFYGELGFVKVSEDEKKNTIWEYDVTTKKGKMNTSIHII